MNALTNTSPSAPSWMTQNEGRLKSPSASWNPYRRKSPRSAPDFRHDFARDVADLLSDRQIGAFGFEAIGQLFSIDLGRWWLRRMPPISSQEIQTRRTYSSSARMILCSREPPPASTRPA